MERSVITWHLITGEYPPAPGGVSDHSAFLARGLVEAGDDVHVWSPTIARQQKSIHGVELHHLPDRFGFRALRVLTQALRKCNERTRIFVQYVPQAFGMKGMNLLFIGWLIRQRCPFWVLFHEVHFPLSLGQRLKHRVLAHVTRRMACAVASRADRVFVTIPRWGMLLEDMMYGGKPIEWLPVPANVVPTASATERDAVRTRLGLAKHKVVGHFGTYRDLEGSGLRESVELLLAERPDAAVLLIGRGSDEVAHLWASAGKPQKISRLHATGAVEADELSALIAACDVMLQPYVDGISSRRTSAMAALAHGIPVVSTRGEATEPIWAEHNAVKLLAVGDVRSAVEQVKSLLVMSSDSVGLGERGRALYEDRFAARHLIAVLRQDELRNPKATGAHPF